MSLALSLCKADSVQATADKCGRVSKEVKFTAAEKAVNFRDVRAIDGIKDV